MRGGDRLPLHVVGSVGTAAGERNNVVDHIARTGAGVALGGWTWMLGFELSLGRARPEDATIGRS
jgi:hypothetical protein